MKPPPDARLPASRWRAIGLWLLDRESRLFALVLGVLAVDEWRTLFVNLDAFRLYLDNGIYQTPLLSLTVTGLSAVYMTVIVGILWAARPPHARYESLLPNALAALAGFGIYGFGLLAPAEEPPLGVAPPLVLLAAGVLLVLWGLVHLRRSFSVVPQARRVVRSGPYRWVRHPMYLGNLLTLAGLGLLIGSAAAIALALALMLLQLWRARYEERLLESTFDEYGDYMNDTNAFVPRLRRRGAGRWLGACGVALGMAAWALAALAALAPAPALAQGQASTPAQRAAKCQAWHKKALAGQWFSTREAEEFAMTDGDQEGLSALPECRRFFELQSRCQSPAIEFMVSFDPDQLEGKLSEELVKADVALVRFIQDVPGCKSVAGFQMVCDAIRVHLKRGKSLTPKLKAMLGACADKTVAGRTSGLIRGAL